ncbi:hypothetical protein E2562_028372 [Oryza meyeriana var. granulata]|uniref:Uncharacterized protein n=1 Tax=Oryza meyeriana var. granulata TaxID=110450 RepID=A0A6G1CVT6_9ORYZ|nr:hypothetical protein E2562_028372 [Oryza meyeriana var. granulata]
MTERCFSLVMEGGCDENDDNYDPFPCGRRDGSAVLDNKIAGPFESFEFQPICVLPPDNIAPNVGYKQPAPNVGGSEQPAIEEADVGESDMFDNEEEYAGVNHDHLYVPPQPTQPAKSHGQPSLTAATGVEATEEEIKVLPFERTLASTKLREGKMVTHSWIANRIHDWLKKNPHKGAKQTLEEQYEIKLKYSKAWSGLKLALEKIHGKYEECFQLLSNWKVEIEMKSVDGLEFYSFSSATSSHSMSLISLR